MIPEMWLFEVLQIYCSLAHMFIYEAVIITLHIRTYRQKVILSRVQRLPTVKVLLPKAAEPIAVISCILLIKVLIC